MMKTIIKILVCFIPIKKLRKRVRNKLLRFANKSKYIKKYKYIKSEWNTKNGGKKLLPGRFSEYDLVFTIGAACPMTWELMAHKLRSFSNPFDWTTGSCPNNWLVDADVWRDTRFITKIRALCTDFKDFFNRDDIKLVSSFGKQEHHDVLNTRTNIKFIHLFPFDKSIDDVWDDVSAKMQHRGKKLIEKINASRKVLICWGHRITDQKDVLDAPVPDHEIKMAVKLLKQKFPAVQIDLVFFEHDGTKKEFEYEKVQVCDNAYRIMSNHYIVTDAYMFVCVPVFFVGWKVPSSESLVIAEALDNVKLSE